MTYQEFLQEVQNNPGMDGATVQNLLDQVSSSGAAPAPAPAPSPAPDPGPGPAPGPAPAPGPSGSPASGGLNISSYLSGLGTPDANALLSLLGGNPAQDMSGGVTANPGTRPSFSGGQANFGAPPGPQQINWGSAAHGPTSGPVTLPDILRSLINQSQVQTGYGQNALVSALGGMGSFNQTLQPQLASSLGLSNQVMSNLPYSSNWAGGQATGDAAQQQQLIQQLLGQTTPTAQGLAGGLNKGLSQSATDMLNATGGRITDPLQALMNQSGFQNQNPGAVAGAGLGTRAEDMLNAFGGQLQPTMQQLLGQNSTLAQGQGLFGQGLAPSTQAALNTQAMDTTAGQYNNAKQAMMTTLLQQGAAGTGGPGGTAQIVNELGGLSAAQQQQQSQLQQQGILANQNVMQQNYGTALGAAGTQLGSQLGALGQGFGAAQGFTGLEQNATDIANQLGLGAAQTMGSLGGQYTNTLQQALQANNQLALGGAQLTGGLAQGLGGMYGNQSLGFTGQVGNMYNTAAQYPQSYMNAYGNNLSGILGGAQALGQMGQAGTSGLSSLTGPFASIQGGNSGILGAILGAAGTALAGPLGGKLAGAL